MIVRNFQSNDIHQLERIHEQYYKNEFSLNDFCKKFINFCVIEDNGIIVSAGGVRTIAESVIMTNKAESSRTKRAALYQMLESQLVTCQQHHIDQLHAFIQDPVWELRLKKTGFKDCKGHALFIEVK